MKFSVSFLGSFLTLLASFSAFAADPFKLVHPADLNQWIKAGAASVHVYDANNDATRTKEGIIPGAQALASSSSYDTAQTLPADKNAKLVFYCANTRCMASHDAAKRAAQAGYKDVNVMADGIEGWKKAGMPTASFKR